MSVRESGACRRESPAVGPFRANGCGKSTARYSAFAPLLRVCQSAAIAVIALNAHQPSFVSIERCVVSDAARPLERARSQLGVLLRSSEHVGLCPPGTPRSSTNSHGARFRAGVFARWARTVTNDDAHLARSTSGAALPSRGAPQRTPSRVYQVIMSRRVRSQRWRGAIGTDRAGTQSVRPPSVPLRVRNDHQPKSMSGRCSRALLRPLTRVQRGP